MSQTWQKGEFYYNRSQGSVGTTLSNTGFSDMRHSFPFKVLIHQKSSDYDSGTLRREFERQVECSAYDGNLFLRMHYLNVSQKRFISDHYECNLRAWLEVKSGLKDEWTVDSWWKEIKNDFLLIFEPVFKGLKKLHMKNQFHGRLSLETGIMVQEWDGKNRGILTDMVVQKGESKIKQQLVDVSALSFIIRSVIKFPCKVDSVHPEVEALCLSQIEFYLKRDSKYYSRTSNTNLPLKWALDPLIFWSVNRKNHFLEALCWVFYPHGQSPSKEILRHSGFKEKWRYDSWDPDLTRVYRKSLAKDVNVFSEPHSVLKFYRDCVQHVNFQQPEQANSPEEIHLTFMRYFDLLPPSINTMNNIFYLRKSSPRLKILSTSLANQIDIEVQDDTKKKEKST